MALTSIYAHLNVSEKPFFISGRYFSFYKPQILLISVAKLLVYCLKRRVLLGIVVGFMRHKGMFKDIKASIINDLRLKKLFYRLR